MAFPIGAQLHYRCDFVVSPRKSGGHQWSELVRAVRRWIVRGLETNEGLLGAWFFTGGQWLNAPQKRLSVVTKREIAAGNKDQPQFWALRYERPCKEVVPFRQWRTDLGISVTDGRFNLSLATCHWLRPGYVGKEPDAPVPTVPGIVRDLLGSKSWWCAAGSERLLHTPRLLGPGDGKLLSERLTAPDRMCPIVLVCRDASEDRPALSVDALSKSLAGTAVVYVANSENAEADWDDFIPYLFRCKKGMVRIYQPVVRFDSQHDAPRHRFFRSEQIQELGEEEVRAQVVRSLARRPGIDSQPWVTTLEDVEARGRENRLQKLRAEVLSGQGKDEYIELLEADNRDLGERASAFREKIDSLQERLMDAQQEAEESQKQIAVQNYFVQDLQRQLRVSKGELSELQGIAELVQGFSKLPSTVLDVAEIMERLHPKRIVFTKRALESAKSREDSLAEITWKLLWAMATTLHDLVFCNERMGTCTNLEDRFKESTGFDLAMIEGKQTKNDKKFMAMRRDKYDGQTFDITPHVKYGKNEPKLLRVHFFIDRSNSRLIVGHCGGHLETYGTARR